MQSLRNIVGIVARVSRQQGTSAAASSSVTKAAAAPSRRMKYPYTFTAKMVQFPYKFHFQNFWLIRYYLCGGFVVYMVFIVWPIHKAGEFATRLIRCTPCSLLSVAGRLLSFFFFSSSAVRGVL